ncbi:hypothetical protein [Enterobacillus tribolii]|uniref:Uncharacterized protein n=1 Tax=Enterobacillus tribolii TaxID=1487935 RepID=A0A370QRZ4_9GAMM|nr:hypothetical protein [Enterobacillus tribolii]MBW7983465.1 hypothetical protein [Enterobacillus tribolii]RDK92040.1 hypothetical protein C8D90_104194 [Enterobacillus tribolii]
MTDTSFSQSFESSITIFRDLIADLSFSQLNDIQLCDLSAVAAESAEGICHGLLYLGESLESCQPVPENLSNISRYLTASAHLLPALMEICHQCAHHLHQQIAQ